MQTNKRNDTQDIRVKCPFCSEKIKPDAKKCRFCGEWINKTDTNSQSIFSWKLNYVPYFWAWFVSLFIFFITLASANFDFSKAPTYLGIVLGVDILIGAISFCLLLVELSRGLISKRDRRNSLTYGLATGLFFVLFFFILYRLPSATTKKPPLISTPPQSTGLTCPQGQLACYLDKGGVCLTPEECQSKMNLKKINTTSVKTTNTQKTNYTSADTPVHCQIDSKCGGGTTPLKKSECDVAKCCLVNGSYKFTKNPNECQDTLVKCNIHTDCGIVSSNIV